MGDADAVARAFVEHYYRTFDQNRSALAGLYTDQSIMTFQSQKFQGQHQIVEKLTQLPFQTCQHRIVSFDAQPSVSGGLLVFVIGEILPEGEHHALRFSQVFHLAPMNNSFIVTNDMFTLNYG